MNNLILDPSIKIMSFLTGKDLAQCSQVSRGWKELTKLATHILFFQTDQRLVKECAGNQDKVYVSTNEKKSASILSQISQLSSQGNTYLGVSGLYSLSLVSAHNKLKNNIDHIVICDISHKVEKFWKSIADLILQSKDCRSFSSRLEHFLFVKEREYLPKSIPLDETNLKRVLNKQLPWKNNAEDYQKLRTIFLNKKFSFVLIDLTNENKSRELSVILKRLELKVGLIYLSNVVEISLKRELPSLGNSINSLVHSQTYVVDTEDRSFKSTLAVSTAHDSLMHGVYAYIDRTSRMYFPSQRLSQYTSLSHCLPLCALAQDLKLKQELPSVLYWYGINKNYFSQDQSQKVLEELVKIMTPNMSNEDILNHEFILFQKHAP